MEFSSLGDGHTWKFGRQGNDESEPQEITLRRWSRACHCSIVEFEDTLKGLVFTSDITDSFIANEVSDVKNLAAAPHRQPQNKAWINGYQNRLLDKIYADLSTGTENKKIDPIKARNWLAAEQTALGILANIFCLACGINFRGWQLSSIRYDCSDSESRNVWIIDQTIVVSHPKAKQRHVDYAPTLVAFPKALSLSLIFYLYLVHPIACKILKALDLDDAMHLTFLWVNSVPVKASQPPSPWDGKCVSSCLRKFTREKMEVSLSPLLTRQISQAVMRDKFPQLFSKITTNETMLSEYGRQCEFPPWKDIKPDRAVKLLAVSQIWQAMLGLGPVMPAWLPIVEGSHIFSFERPDNWETASFSARRLLAIHLKEGQALNEYIDVSIVPRRFWVPTHFALFSF